MSAQVDYDEHQWTVYERARGLTPERVRHWSEVFRRHVDVGPGATVLDLGCGTGAYSELMADAFDSEVIAVEPSERIREVAAREHGQPRVGYVAGAAERIPLPADACDAALLSNVLHHLADRDACARELRRVLRPGGTLLVRGALRGSRISFIEFFPEARPVAREQMDPPEEVVAVFAGAGLAHVASERVAQETAPDLRTWYERIELRGISTLELISDDAFERGLARMREAVEREREPTPVVDEIDLLVFRRP